LETSVSNHRSEIQWLRREVGKLPFQTPLRAPPEEELPLARAPSTGPLTSAAASPASRVLRQAAAGGAALREHPRRRSRPLRSGPPPAHSRRPLTGCTALGHGDPPLLQLYPDVAVHYQAAPRWATRPASTSPATTRINLARHDAVSEAARPCSELCCLFQCSSCAFCV
jgi:hypothetical protein